MPGIYLTCMLLPRHAKGVLGLQNIYMSDALYDNTLLYELSKGHCTHKLAQLGHAGKVTGQMSCMCFSTPSGMSCRQTKRPLKLMQKLVQLQTAAAGMGNKKYARSVASSSIPKRLVSGIIRWVAITGGKIVRLLAPAVSSTHANMLCMHLQ